MLYKRKEGDGAVQIGGAGDGVGEVFDDDLACDLARGAAAHSVFVTFALIFLQWRSVCSVIRSKVCIRLSCLAAFFENFTRDCGWFSCF